MASPECSPPPECGHDGLDTVLVGVDGSNSSLRALSFAVGVARRNRAKLIALFVRGPIVNPAAVAAVACAAEPMMLALAADLKIREDEIRVMLGQAAAGGLDAAELEVRSGDVATELADAAERHHADAVVIGASEHALHHIYGSVAARLVRHPLCPVMVVP